MTLRYSKLPNSTSFRLLKLLPRLNDGDLQCSLETVDLQESPKFHALSYVWGNPTKNHRIWVDGQECHIHENLWQFLTQMHKDGYYERIWTDALCINQLDIVEKGSQVAMMFDIYSGADLVMCWLGPEGTLDCDTFDVLHDYSRQSVKWLEERFDKGSGDKIKDPVDQRFMSLVSRLLKIEYWSRMWIVQEFTACPDARLICGSISFPADSFVDLMSKIAQAVDAAYLMFDGFLPTLGVFRARKAQKYREVGSIGAYLSQFLTDSRCAIPHDKVYALYGILPLFLDPRIKGWELQVDYQCPIQDLFWHAFFMCVCVVPPTWVKRFDDFCTGFNVQLERPQDDLVRFLHLQLQHQNYAPSSSLSQRYCDVGLALAVIHAFRTLSYAHGRPTDPTFYQWIKYDKLGQRIKPNTRAGEVDSNDGPDINAINAMCIGFALSDIIFTRQEGRSYDDNTTTTATAAPSSPLREPPSLSPSKHSASPWTCVYHFHTLWHKEQQQQPTHNLNPNPNPDPPHIVPGCGLCYHQTTFPTSKSTSTSTPTITPTLTTAQEEETEDLICILPHKFTPNSTEILVIKNKNLYRLYPDTIPFYERDHEHKDNKFNHEKTEILWGKDYSSVGGSVGD